MKNNFTPLLVTTPRTGSTLIHKLLGNIGKQTADFKNNLNEFFTITPWIDLKYSNFKVFNDTIIGLISNDTLNNRNIHTENKFLHEIDFVKLYHEKIQMLQDNSFKYMIKLIPYMIDDFTINFLNNEYDFIYLERRDKLSQLLSYTTFKNTGITHYLKDDTTVIDKIEFDPKFLWLLNRIYEDYHKIKQSFPGPTLYYEDLMAERITEESILRCLNMDIKIDNPLAIQTRSSTYLEIDRELLINNPELWLKYKPEFLKLSSSW